MQPWVIVPLPGTPDPAVALARVAGESALVRVIRSMSDATASTRIVVASPAIHADDAAETLRAAGLGTVSVAPARSPGSRRDVIAAGLRHLDVHRHSQEPVLLGDCRHPLSPGALADRVIAALADGHDVVVPTLAVTDTVKTVDALGSVLGTVDRTTLRTVQYPRGFTASVLWNLVATPSPTAVTSDGDDDEFDEALRAGLDIATVAGDPNASQVLLPRDAALLEAIIASASC